MKRAALMPALRALTAVFALTMVALPVGADTSLERDAIYGEQAFGDQVFEAQEETKSVATAEVIVLFASNAGTGIEDCAKHLKALKQPPLSSYDSYACLTNKKLPLSLKAKASMATPDKGKLTLMLNEVVPRENKKPKYNVDVQIDRADGTKYVSTNVKAPEGKYFFLAGQKYTKGDVEGVLVFAIRMQAP